jgi:hypothetical protein
MPSPMACEIVLTSEESETLAALSRASSTPQALAFRARLILRAADDDEPTNGRIATELSCSRHTVAKWRDRFGAARLPGLQDAPRSGRPLSFSPR